MNYDIFGTLNVTNKIERAIMMDYLALAVPELLTERQRLIFDLMYNQKLPQKDIAFLLNMTVSAVSRLHARGIATLKKHARYIFLYKNYLTF